MLDIIYKHLPAWLGTYRAASTTPKPNFKNGFQVDGSDYTATELNSALGGGVPATAGTVTANKPVIVDSSKNALGFGSLQTGALDIGTSGSAGDIDIFPSTSAKGKIRLAAADNAGDTVTTVTNASQAAARTYTIPDASTSASSDTNWQFVLMRTGSGAPSGFAAAQGSLYVDTGNGNLYVCTTGSATSATFALVGTQS